MDVVSDIAAPLAKSMDSRFRGNDGKGPEEVLETPVTP